MTVVAVAAGDVGPERLSPAIGEVTAVVEILDGGQAVDAPLLVLAILLVERPGGVAQPHRGVRIDWPQREVLGHALDEPQRDLRGAVLARRRVGVRRHVELEGVDELVAEDVIGVGERSAERQHDAAAQRLGDAAGALAELALNRVGLLEVGMRRVEHQRLASAQFVPEDPAEANAPAFGHARGEVDALHALPGSSRCRSSRSSGPGNRASCTGPCCGRSTAPTQAASGEG